MSRVIIIESKCIWLFGIVTLMLPLCQSTPILASFCEAMFATKSCRLNCIIEDSFYWSWRPSSVQWERIRNASQHNHSNLIDCVEKPKLVIEIVKYFKFYSYCYTAAILIDYFTGTESVAHFFIRCNFCFDFTPFTTRKKSKSMWNQAKKNICLTLWLWKIE